MFYGLHCAEFYKFRSSRVNIEPGSMRYGLDMSLSGILDKMRVLYYTHSHYEYMPPHKDENNMLEYYNRT